MIQLVYISSAVHLMDDQELKEILQIARENNTREDITGLLLYRGGNFIQVLEGPEDAVMNLYGKISRDPRHTGVETLLKGPITERQFADWSMGFQNVDKLSSADLLGFSEFLTEPFTREAFQANPNRASILLLTFKKNMR